MVRKFGVSLDDAIADEIEESLEYGDKRSARIQHLLNAGLAVEAAFEREGFEVPLDRERDVRAFIRQVFDEYEE